MAVLSLGLFATKEVSADEISIEVSPGDTLVEIANNESIELDTLIELNPQIKNPNLIFPGQTINLANQGVAQDDSKAISDDSYGQSVVPATDGAQYLLAQLVEAEAGNQSFEGRVAVANVVLNRVASGKFPNSIEAVIYQSGQFSPITDGAINNVPTAESIRAVQVAVNAGGSPYGALYFYNPATAGGQAWFNALETTNVIGNHVFKR